MNERKVFKKLDGKDLINIGVFTAIIFCCVFAVANARDDTDFFGPSYCFCTTCRRHYF